MPTSTVGRRIGFWVPQASNWSWTRQPWAEVALPNIGAGLSSVGGRLDSSPLGRQSTQNPAEALLRQRGGGEKDVNLVPVSLHTRITPCEIDSFCGF